MPADTEPGIPRLVRIIRRPPDINPALGAVLIDLCVEVDPALRSLTDDPAFGRDAYALFLDNRAMRTALDTKFGAELSETMGICLPLGRATRIPFDCYIYTAVIPDDPGFATPHPPMNTPKEE